MVRLLALAIMCVSVSAAAAHDTGGCGDDALVSPQVDALLTKKYRFLKKLTAEIDQQFPADKFYRMGVDRATGPLVASLQQSGTQATTLPIRASFDHDLPAGSKASGRMTEALKAHLPLSTDGKTLLLMFYDDEPAFIVAFVKEVQKFYAANNLTVDVKAQIFTSQMRVKWVQEATTVLLGAKNVSVRAIAASNEVRHWMKDLRHENETAVHEFPMVDVYGDGMITHDGKQRAKFIELKARLANLDN